MYSLHAFLAVCWSVLASNHLRKCFIYLMLVNQLAKAIAWWFVYRISFYGNDFKFVFI